MGRCPARDRHDREERMNPKQEHLIACAYHEAGHAVVASILGDDVVDVRINIDAPSVREIHGGVTRSLCCRPVVCRSRTWAGSEDLVR